MAAAAAGRRSGEAVAAIDATFSAPKSVSAVWAVADPELRAAIEQAHEQAIDRALAYATRQVPMVRRRIDQDRVVHEKATGLVATSWRHTTARAVAEQVPDPQLHSHVLLHAAVRATASWWRSTRGPGWCTSASSAPPTGPSWLAG